MLGRLVLGIKLEESYKISSYLILTNQSKTLLPLPSTSTSSISNLLNLFFKKEALGIKKQ